MNNRLDNEAEETAACLIVTCPFCGNKVNRLYDICNGFCSCGAKYYVRDKMWLNRKTGERVYEINKTN